MTFEERIAVVRELAKKSLDKLELMHMARDHNGACRKIESIADRIWGEGNRPIGWEFDLKSPPPSDTKDQVVRKYLKACKMADDVREIDGQACQVIEGTNDGYFIEVFGKSFRFASVTDPKVIAQLFVDMVAAGPDVRIP